MPAQLSYWHVRSSPIMTEQFNDATLTGLLLWGIKNLPKYFCA